MTHRRSLSSSTGRLALLVPLIVAHLLTAPLWAGVSDGSATPGAASAELSFADAVDLTDLGRVAVHYEGRVKSFDSFARTIMQRVSGPHRIDDQSPAFTYLDMAITPQAYVDRDVIFVKMKLMRGQIIRALESGGMVRAPDFSRRMDEFLETGLISEEFLLRPEVLDLLEGLRADLLRSARFVEMIDAAAGYKNPGVLHDHLRIVPPWEGSAEDRWLSMQELVAAHGNPAVTAFPADRRQAITDTWERMRAAWVDRDAEGVNTASRELAPLLRAVTPALYPSESRLDWESRYFRYHSMTWVWIFYLLSIVPLLVAIVYRWKGAGRLGIALFGLAFALHTVALLWRTYVADRWPNSNMFEAVTTAAWFGGVMALPLEYWVRKTGMRYLFLLGSAAASMVGLMAAHFLPIALTANIGNKMPVLHDVWLFIHTNVIIASYCSIFMAAISATLYLIHRAFGGRAEYVRVGGAGAVMAGGSGRGNGGLGQVCDGVTMVLMELSFVMLWAGIVMGAIWADHSWGRPWGWDPKEVFALNTFLIFALLVHVRIRTHDKGLWTALLAVVGAGVMLVNWIVINFKISGLHSYA